MSLNLFEVVRYEGEETRNILAWRHPNKNMKPGTTLIVNPGQRAVFFSNGRAVASYEEGKHKIEGNNTQGLAKLKSFVSGGVSPDSSFLWFVNMYDLQPIGWGTPSPILVRDPESQIPVELKTHGNFIPRIIDLETFILEFMPSYPDVITAEVFQKRFRQAAIGTITSGISRVIANSRIATIDIEMHSQDIAQGLSELLSNRFAKYGISVQEFNIEALKVNQDSEGYKEVFRFHKQVLSAKGERSTREIEGYSYQEERQFDVLEKAAQNEGSAGNLMGAGMGVSMGLGMGANFGTLMGNLGQGAHSAQQPQIPIQTEKMINSENSPTVSLAKFCGQCGTAFTDGAKFCSNCGQSR
ncbi:TPA: SPFH domain-containing protein [Streptococcus suis]|nr:SPFH domain-containing protein [Streptococcus suis]